MTTIPTEIHKKLSKTLLHCAPFDNQMEIRTYFNDTPLKPWQYKLPEADNMEARVDLTIAFLLNKRTSSQENALILFLQVLRDRTDSGDDCYWQLNELIELLQVVLDKEVASVPFIPEANTKQENMISIASDEKLIRCAKAVGLVSVQQAIKGKIKRKITGTGWLITPQLALTCWHVIHARTGWDEPAQEDDLQYQAKNLLVRFDHTHLVQGTEYGLTQLEHYHRKLDYALLRLTDRSDSPLSQRGFLTLDIDLPLTIQSQLVILQHPQGQVQQRATGTYIKPSELRGRILYDTPTASGTSGAPVLNATNWSVVALHTGENQNEKLREGILLKDILIDLSQNKPLLFEEITTYQSDKE